MTIRPKTKRRLLVLLCATVVIGSLGAGIVHYRLGVVDARYKKYKDDGMAAYNQGRYEDAIPLLLEYKHRHPEEADVLLDYGMACSKAEDPDPTHPLLFQAIDALRNYCSVKPDDIETKHYLLKLESPV